MNSERTKTIARREMPIVAAEIVPGSSRYDVIDALRGSDNVGIELGVAKGFFSQKMVESGKFRQFFGVDIYGDIHDTEEYKLALKRVGLDANCKLLRMTFDEAIDLFEDEYFDFIYADGFAHTGEEGGETLIKWYRKLKIGGVFAGDDYHDDWPLVKWAVNDFVSQIRVRHSLTEKAGDDVYSQYPSWFILKERASAQGALSVSNLLLKVAREERARIHRERTQRPGPLRRWAVRALDLVGLKEPLRSVLAEMRGRAGE